MGSIIGVSTAALLTVLFIVALILAFEVWMFIAVLRNDRITSDRKILWAIGMVVIHPFVAIAYYFTDYRR